MDLKTEMLRALDALNAVVNSRFAEAWQYDEAMESAINRVQVAAFALISNLEESK